MYQEQLLSAIRKKISTKDSLIECIAAVLDISYDAAHRRVSLKSKFSIEEAVSLIKYYGISMQQVFDNTDYILVKKTKDIKTHEDLATYLVNAWEALSIFKPDLETTLYYSAKDIPLFYVVDVNILSKFKLYVWLHLLSSDYETLSFENFQFKGPLLEYSRRLKNFYASTQVNEIWNDTTINSTLQQVFHFYQSGMLGIETAKLLFDGVEELINNLENSCHDKNKQYQLYYHDLLILNNNVLIRDSIQKSLFVPFTMIGYFITQDTQSCNNAHEFYQRQIKNSKLLNTAGTRDKKIFFNKMYQKINFYRAQVDNYQETLL